jgi:hypothetical protein
MAPPDDKTDWTNVNKVVQRRAMDADLPINPDAASSPASGIVRPGSNAPVSPEGVIANFKANKITRTAVLEHLKAFHGAQLEAAKHHLSEAVRVRKADSTATAEQFLQLINARQVQFLTEIGLRDNQARGAALMTLQSQTADMLKQATSQDWPEALKDKAIAGILELNSRFFERLMTELGTK